MTDSTVFPADTGRGAGAGVGTDGGTLGAETRAGGGAASGADTIPLLIRFGSNPLGIGLNDQNPSTPRRNGVPTRLADDCGKMKIPSPFRPFFGL